MNRRLVFAATALMVGPASAGTFDPVDIAPELGADVITRAVSRQAVGKDLFSSPYANVVVGEVDVYDTFPYVDAHYVQVVSDPGWSRLLYGEVGKELRAYDGNGTPLGKLSEPHGMAVDADGRVYVADTGNDRVLVLDPVRSGDETRLVPLFEVTGLRRPFDVAVSDAGTPLDTSDDRLYVADTGRNRVAAYSLDGGGATFQSALGELGSGRGYFAGPMAVAVGRRDGASTSEVYVADAHTRRLVSLTDGEGGLTWRSEQRHAANVVTALDTDQWGNVYATAPHAGEVKKYSPTLTPLAELRGSVNRPRSFHVPFVTVRDHRDGTVTRSGEASAVLVEEWGDASGMRMWSLGSEATDVAVSLDGGLSARFLLTDPADVSVELQNLGTGTVVASRSMGALEAGPQSVAFEADDFTAALEMGDYQVKIHAQSRYEDGETEVAQATFSLGSEGLALTPSRPLFLGNHPNPMRGSSTRVQFLMPDTEAADATLRIYDPQGREVKTFAAQNLSPGLQSFDWDGTDAGGRNVAAGVYFYRLHVADRSFENRVVLLR